MDDVKAAAAVRGGLRECSDVGGKLELFYKLSFWVDLIVCGRGLYSFPFPLNLSLPCSFLLNLSLLCPLHYPH